MKSIHIATLGDLQEHGYGITGRREPLDHWRLGPRDSHPRPKFVLGYDHSHPRPKFVLGYDPAALALVNLACAYIGPTCFLPFS